jgi:hypothetical protein
MKPQKRDLRIKTNNGCLLVMMDAPREASKKKTFDDPLLYILIEYHYQCLLFKSVSPSSSNISYYSDPFFFLLLSPSPRPLSLSLSLKQSLSLSLSLRNEEIDHSN